MKINKMYRKVRKNASSLKSNPGKTLRYGKPLSEDYSPESTTEFSLASANSREGDLPAMPLDVTDSASEGNGDTQYYRYSPRVVHFDEEVLVRKVRPVCKIGGEIDARVLWYQLDEYKEIMWKAQKMVKRALNDEENTNNEEKYCLRGLEHIVNSVPGQKKDKKKWLEAVLDEQCDQLRRDFFPLDDNSIKSVYVPHTKVHRAEAVERAIADAEEARRYQKTKSSSRPSRYTNSLHSSSSSLLSLTSPITPRSSLNLPRSPLSFASPKSPKSPSLHKPGMMFTNVNNTIQYPAAMKLETL